MIPGIPQAFRCVGEEDEFARECKRLTAENRRLRELAKASLDARDKEAKASMAVDVALANFTDYRGEVAAHEKARIEASAADSALREAIMGSNVEGQRAAKPSAAPES